MAKEQKPFADRGAIIPSTKGRIGKRCSHDNRRTRWHDARASHVLEVFLPRDVFMIPPGERRDYSNGREPEVDTFPRCGVRAGFTRVCPSICHQSG
ncbi:hypothetical protein TNIN_345711 [Trichonephila inaurata madagascariensis]|uniref:Uncharacterized protein n=1 Tax=Trichonephila inaurata madagascariensis TaxID=2747483 RepID=A0A8X6YTD2_9ARAC|nr:hypothetical protein TNIN_345711 [Trichonephila inaurata madagascariensis]